MTPSSTHAFTLDDRAATALAWADLLQHLVSRCHTERGQALAGALPFLADRQSVELELELVAEARACHDAHEPLPFGSVHSGLEVALTRLDKKVLRETLKGLVHSMQIDALLRRQKKLLKDWEKTR